MDPWDLEEVADENGDFIESENSQANKFLTFHIAEEGYCIEISKITEIVEIQRITRVPESYPYIKGVMNLRGNVIPVMDLRLRFGMEEAKHTSRTCVIIVMEQEILVGLIVDSVSEVAEIIDKNIEPILEKQNGTNQFVKGIGKINNQIKMLIDLKPLLFDEV